MELLPRLRWLGLHLWLAKRGASPATVGGCGCGVNPLGQPAASGLGPAAARGSQGNTEAWWWGDPGDPPLVPENTREPTRKEGLSMKYIEILGWICCVDFVVCVFSHESTVTFVGGHLQGRNWRGWWIWSWKSKASSWALALTRSRAPGL